MKYLVGKNVYNRKVVSHQWKQITGVVIQPHCIQNFLSIDSLLSFKIQLLLSLIGHFLIRPT